MLKVVLGERSKFIYELPVSVEELKKSTVKVFRLNERENPEDGGRKISEIESSLEFVYVDP